ncbi:hypothetical protein [Vibrio paracholerae]|uniref:hypothetical protein n=1 Tax=Vibrio paracholerae TaxID=650003 RepID=UPI0020943BD7|nr:hypothetical protein [Vibrio paracholerae]MCO7020915.1 hypothetical protein [Vibrio paracholerae]
MENENKSQDYADLAKQKTKKSHGIEKNIILGLEKHLEQEREKTIRKLMMLIAIAIAIVVGVFVLI